MKEYLSNGNSYEKTSIISTKEDVILLSEMIRIRQIEEAIAFRYKEDEMKTPVHLMIGQEATVVAACSQMTREDKVFCSHRTHGVYLAKGGDVKAMMLELYGRVGGCSGTRGGSMHLIDKKVGIDGVSAIVGGIVPIATGASFAHKGKNILTTVFFGDAAIEEGVVSESFNMAALWKLPIVFFCENNFYSVCTPLHQRQLQESLIEKARAQGVYSIKIDGNNVYEVMAAVKEAKDRALKGEGPTFIEAVVYRWLAHGGSEDDTWTGYRTENEVKNWKNICPIKTFEKFLLKHKVITQEEIQELWRSEKERIDRLIEEVRKAPIPDVSEVLEYVYAK